MKQVIYGVLLLALMGVLVGCGRQLPEGGLPTPVRQPTEPPPTAVAAAPEVTAEVEAAATEEAAAAATQEAEEAAATEEAVDAEAEAVVTEEAAAEGDADSAEAVAVSGDPAAGEELFNLYIDAAAFSCANCHLVDSEDRLVGPGMLGLGELAATRVEGQSAAEYLRNSILHPNDYVVDTYPENLMPGVYADELSEEDLDNLVAYLLTL